MDVITDRTDPFSDKDTLDLAIYRLEVSPIVIRFGTWAITDYGVECLTHHYPVAKTRVHELDWVTHMKVKKWVNIYDFGLALHRARLIWEATS